MEEAMEEVMAVAADIEVAEEVEVEAIMEVEGTGIQVTRKPYDGNQMVMLLTSCRPTTSSRRPRPW
jgi:hypothetical protein